VFCCGVHVRARLAEQLDRLGVAGVVIVGAQMTECDPKQPRIGRDGPQRGDRLGLELVKLATGKAGARRPSAGRRRSLPYGRGGLHQPQSVLRPLAAARITLLP
jgi:hypothetical protein